MKKKLNAYSMINHTCD